MTSVESTSPPPTITVGGIVGGGSLGDIPGDLLPSGDVLAHLFDSHPTGSGDLDLGWEILSGPLQGQTFWTQEAAGGRRTLGRICDALRTAPTSTAQDLYLRPVTVSASVEIGEGGPVSRIKGCKPAVPRGVPAPVATVQKGTVELPDALTHVPGLLGTITDYITDSAVSPLRGLALGAALVLIGTAAGRKFGGPTFSGTHLYILALAPTGAGKDHPMTMIGTILDASGMGALNGPSAFKSDSSVVNTLIRKPLMVCGMDEFGSFLRKINGKKAGGFEQAITGILRSAWGASFSSFTSPAYAASDGQRIVAPALSIFGPSTPGEFYAAVEGGDIYNGLLNRFLLIGTAVNPEPRKPPLDKFEVPHEITAAMATIYNAGGGALLNATMHGVTANRPEILVPWADDQAERVFERLREDIRERTSDAEMLVRTAEMAVRMATIRAIGISSHDPRVTVEDMEWGRDLAMWSAERMIVDARAYVAESDHQSALNKALRIIQKAGRISRSDFCRQTQWVRDPRQREDILKDLEQSNQIIIEETSGGKVGRPKGWISLVH